MTYSVMDDYFPPPGPGETVMAEEWLATTRRGVMEFLVVRRVLVPQMIEVKLTLVREARDA